MNEEDIINKLVEVSDIVKSDEETTYLQTRYDEFADGSKKVLSFGRVVVTEEDGKTPKKGDISQDEIMTFAKARVDAPIETIYSATTTKSDNADGTIPAPVDTTTHA